MLKEISTITKQVGRELVSEIKVVDTKNNKEYYVANTYDYEITWSVTEKSILGVLNGKENPSTPIESFTYLPNKEETRFYSFYKKATKELNKYIDSKTNRIRHSSLKEKPNTLNYEILDKKYNVVADINPKRIYQNYEMKVSVNGLLTVYVYARDEDDYYSLSLYSAYDDYVPEIFEEEVVIDRTPFEEHHGIKDSYDSIYYDLFYEIEKYKDEDNKKLRSIYK